MNEVVKPHQFVSRPRESDRRTCGPLPPWDRVKFFVLIVAAFWLFVWIEIGDNPILPVSQAIRHTIDARWWLFLLFGLELLRQLHYVLSEHWPSYHLTWTRKIVGNWNDFTERFRPWTRFRLARAIKVLIFLAVLDYILAKSFDEPMATGLLKIFNVFDLFFTSSFGLVAFYMVIGIAQFVGIFWFMSKGGVSVYYPDDVQTRFEDVWGQDGVLEKVKENLIFLEDPKSIEDRGGHVPGGILLYGPPGTGKTLMAEAVAGETGNPYVFVEPGAFSNMFFGVGVLKVRSLFKKLRKLALKYGGVIVFFDEADALGNRGLSTQSATAATAMTEACNGPAYLSLPARQALIHDLTLAAGTADDGSSRSRARRFFMPGMGRGGGDPMALTALLAEISGLKKPRGILNRYVRRLFNMRPKPPPKYRILMIMATNMPDSLDAAFLRPGRIDRIYKVGYPSKDGRRRTYEGYLAKVRHQLTAEQIDRLSVMSPHATGATVKDMVNEALVNAIRDGRDTITWPDVLRAKHHKEHGLPDEAEYITRERHAVAIHEACHAVAFYRLHRGVAIDVATIERRGDIGGFVAPIPLEDQFFTWKSENEVDIMISLASLAGERMFFDGDSSMGVGGDLRSATTVAMQMEAFVAQGETVASHFVTKAGDARQLGQSVETGTDRQWLETPFGNRVEARLQELLERVRVILDRDRVMVLAVAHAMEQHRTISGEDVAAIMEGYSGPVVDGHRYHQADFQAELEEYHRSALLAHQQTATVAMALPSLNGRTNGHGPSISGAHDDHGAAVVDADGRPVTAPPGPEVGVATAPPTAPEPARIAGAHSSQAPYAARRGPTFSSPPFPASSDATSATPEPANGTAAKRPRWWRRKRP